MNVLQYPIMVFHGATHLLDMETVLHLVLHLYLQLLHQLPHLPQAIWYYIENVKGSLYHVFLGCQTSSGEPCRIPFTYRGVEYKGCTTVGNNGVPWCYTANGYGNCAESCDSCSCNSKSGKVSTGCPQKISQVCFLSISSSNLYEIQNLRSVLKSARPEDFKTVLDFQSR